MQRRRFRALVGVSAAALALAVTSLSMPAQADHEGLDAASGSPGDDTIVVPINDSAAGGTYYQPFERAYAGETPEGTPVYVYVPTGTFDGAEGPQPRPGLRPQPGRRVRPLRRRLAGDFTITQAQIDYLGDELANQIVEVDEAHFGLDGRGGPGRPASDSLVTLVYNVQDDDYYNCAGTATRPATSPPTSSTASA